MFRVVTVAVIVLAGTLYASAEGVYFATGIKIGEVTSSRALVWARLTRQPSRVGIEAPLPEVLYRDSKTGELFERTRGRPNADPVVTFPNGSDIDTIEGAAPGAPGEVRVMYRPEGNTKWKATAWRSVGPEKDYIRQFELSALDPGKCYALRVEGRSVNANEAASSIDGRFCTAPSSDAAAPVLFTVSTGQAYNDRDLPSGGFKIYSAMLELEPDFFVHTGDIVYYDNLAKTLPLARWHWARTYSFPSNVEFHRNVPSYFIKDDHDTWMNDSWPGMESRFMGDFTFDQGLAVFREQVPMGRETYRTFRWGADLQIWLVEGRDFRSPNTMPDGPEKTIWGDKQKRWFKRSVMQSDATFRILISPTPLVGPDRPNKRDNHSNEVFAHEGRELRRFVADQENMFVVCGDRHWQYISEDLETGLREYSSGPASNEHAGGWKSENVLPEHKYLNVTGGFMAVSVERHEGVARMTVRHYSVDGEVLHEDIRVSE